MEEHKDSAEKNGDQELHFNYNRADRLLLPTAPRVSDRKGGILRGNRSLLILLLDVLLIAIIMIIGRLYLFVPAEVPTAQLGGCTFALRADSYEDVVLVYVTIRKTAEAHQVPTDGKVSVIFLIEDTDENAVSSGFLPASTTDRDTVIAATLPRLGEKGVLVAEITVGDEVVRLTRRIQRD